MSGRSEVKLVVGVALPQVLDDVEGKAPLIVLALMQHHQVGIPLVGLPLAQFDAQRLKVVPVALGVRL